MVPVSAAWKWCFSLWFLWLQNEVLGLMRDIFSFDKVRYTSLPQLSDDILRLAKKRVAVASAKLSSWRRRWGHSEHYIHKMFISGVARLCAQPGFPAGKKSRCQLKCPVRCIAPRSCNFIATCVDITRDRIWSPLTDNWCLIAGITQPIVLSHSICCSSSSRLCLHWRFWHLLLQLWYVVELFADIRSVGRGTVNCTRHWSKPRIYLFAIFFTAWQGQSCCHWCNSACRDVCEVMICRPELWRTSVLRLTCTE